MKTSRSCQKIDFSIKSSVKNEKRVKMAKKSKFLGFFRNHARNVLHIEIHLPEEILAEKNYLGRFREVRKFKKYT